MRLDSPFLFQMVEENTRLLILYDLVKDFVFETLFDIVTDGMQIEKKGETAIWVPFEDSPKILMSSNYILGKNQSSYKRRMYEVEFCHFYSDKHQPIDDFRRNFFIQWDPEDWAQFFAFMIHCVQMYLRYGLFEIEHENSWRAIQEKTSPEFMKFCKTIKLQQDHNKSELYQEYMDRFSKDPNLLQNTFTKWLRMYADARKILMDERKSNNKQLVKFTKLPPSPNAKNGRRTGSFMDEIEHHPVEPLTESELFGESEAE